MKSSPIGTDWMASYWLYVHLLYRSYLNANIEAMLWLQNILTGLHCILFSSNAKFLLFSFIIACKLADQLSLYKCLEIKCATG